MPQQKRLSQINPVFMTRFRNGIFSFFLIFLFFLLPVLSEAREKPSENTPRKILLISSFHLNHTWTEGVNHAILKKLETTPGKYIVDYLELNSIRNRKADYNRKFQPYLDMLQNRQYDLVVAILDDAMTLLLNHYEKLPADLPIIFCGYQEIIEKFQKKYPNITGLAIHFDVMKTVEIGLQLMPKTREIAIITDNFKSGIRLHQRIQEEFKNFKRCKITQIHGENHTTQQMLDAVKKLPENSFVIFAPWRTFAKDGFASLENVAEKLSKQSRPFLVLTDVLLEHGALGGYVTRGSECGHLIAQQIHRILSSKNRKNVPFLHNDGKLVLNQNTMRQYNLSRQGLPPDTVFLHNEFSLWEHYSDIMTALIAFILLILILLTTTLVLHIRFRIHTKRTMAMFSTLPLRVLVTNRNGELLFYQGDKNAPVQTAGIKKIEDLLSRSNIHIENPMQYIHYTLDTGQDCEINYHIENKTRKAVCSKLPNEAFGKDVVMWISQDITDLYEKQQELDRNLLLMSRAAEVSEITYFKGDKNACVTLTGGNLEIGLNHGKEKTPLIDWIIPEDRNLFEKGKERLLQGSQEVMDIICRSDATGIRRTYRIRVTRDNGNDQSYFGIIQDITEQRNAQKQKNELISRLNSHVETEQIVNTCLTKLVTGTDLNRNIEEILAGLAEQFQCKFAGFGEFQENGKLFEFTHEWNVRARNGRSTGIDVALKQTLANHYAELQQEQYQFYQNTEDSPFLPLFHAIGLQTLLAVPIRFGDQLSGIFCIGFARQKYLLTEREKNMLPSAIRIISIAKQQEQERRILDATIHEREIIFKNVNVPIMLFDHTGKMIRVNPAAAEMCGITTQEAIDSPCYLNFCGEPSQPEFCPIREVLATGKHTSVELTINGREYIMSADPIFDNNGKLVNIVENALDMTVLNQQKRELESAMKAAQTADRAKSYFLATMSHELRTPLNAILGFSELLQKENYSKDEEMEYLKSINNSGNSLLNLITDILELTKLEADQINLNPEEINLNHFMEEIDSIFKFKAQKKKINFTIDCPVNLPILHLDALRLRQILLNLIGNALKFTPKGGTVSLEIRMKRNNPESADLQFKIKDTGIGISEEFQEHMFEPFAQQDSVRGNRAYDGSGLGLTITRRLVDHMKGTLLCDSREGKGTVFTLQLNNIHSLEGRKLLTQGVLPPKQEPVLKTCSILLVDDVPMNLKVLESMLKKLGMKTCSATSGKEALELLKKEPADMVLTDMWMPGMNGEELAAQIRGNPAYQHLRIYAITADTEVQNHFDTSLFAGILHKPILMKTLESLFQD